VSMIHFDLPKEKSSIIKVIGVGGGGSNAVNHMYSQTIEGVNFITCNTDAQALACSKIPNRIQLGPNLTQGLGAGANPDIGRQATEESLEEIKSILEVNTKMAFITAGMGGGTGTGGAPIIAKICKDLGILTVGIVTLPFAYEGKKRQLQAEEGIKTLKQYVDTLLVISNDKLRHQFGNLKMREAFERADNVLATAAKCITDVISSTGQINVDFADVCTVMKNGGVAILGSAATSGENRAHRAIEEALNSPLLNDSDIRGAKWILININSAEGETEFTMDEVEIIQTHLLTQAGEGTDVILGLGYDNTLGDKLGITLIATGFEHKDPFTRKEPKKPEPKKEEKIIMVLGQPEEEKKDNKNAKASASPLETEGVKPDIISSLSKVVQMNRGDKKPEIAYSSLLPVINKEEKTEKTVALDRLAPRLVEDFTDEIPMPGMNDIIETDHIKDEEPVILLRLNEDEKTPGKNTNEDGVNTGSKMFITEKDQDIDSHNHPALSADRQVSTGSQSISSSISKKENSAEPVSPKTKKEEITKHSTPPLPAASGGYLARPSNIYAESKLEVNTSKNSDEERVPPSFAADEEEQELLDLQMQLVERDNIPAADMPLAHQAQPPLTTDAEDLALQDEAEEQKRRATERLHKLRNLSFNVSGADPNNEFENVPAYIRRNMELYNSNSHIENFYSNYEVKKGADDKTEISTINTFLDGKKPD
ncbi:MAG TPA: cell division protein FtsZ, partial [Chitinophagaceae bacterium]|nr:cell division protein FtsZ [Chitinophagaceae bacterium]